MGRPAARPTCWIALAVFWTLLLASPAAAHTSLLLSDPENRSVVNDPPRVARIQFTKPVDPRTVSAELLNADGTSPGRPELTTALRPDTAVVEFDLPDLGDATYGLRWRSVGRDGHVAEGEIVFMVSSDEVVTRDEPQFIGGSAKDPADGRWAQRVFDALLTVGRLLWYVGLALLVGSWFLARWRSRSEPINTERGDLPDPQVTARWGRRWATTGLAVSSVSAVGTVALGFSEPFTTAAFATAVSTTPARLSLVAVFLVLSVRASDLVALPESNRLRYVRGRGALVGATLAVASSGHAWTGPSPLVNSAIATVHMLGAAAWLGPMLLLAVTSKSGWHRAADGGDTALHSYLVAFSRVAVGAFGVLTVTGLYAAWLHTGFNVTGGRYAAILAVKAVLVVAVVGPLGVYHHRRVSKARVDRTERRPVGRISGRTLRVEFATGIAVLVLAVLLSSSVPDGERTVVAAAAEMAGAASPAGPTDCDELTVGQANCYRDAFADIMQREGVASALAAIDETREAGGFVAQRCHQITHDLGNDASQVLGLAQALAQDGSLCASGYYHGALEQTLTTIDDESLVEQLPGLCSSVTSEPYSAVHYSCVHGVGHGVMLRSGLDLFASLETCEAFTDAWERYACWSGAFMENVVSVQEGGADGTFRVDDPLYPCNAVDEARMAACFSIQTGYILWQNGGDLSGGFAACEAADTAYVDDCYQSMGRDISGFSELDIDRVLSGCALGDVRWRESCYVGAALDAVYQENGTTTATQLCERLPIEHRSTCRNSVDQLAARL